MTILGFFIIILLVTAIIWLIIIARKEKERQRRELLLNLFEKNYPETFLAIDTETATKSGDVCQLGYAVVEKGEIVSSKSYLIKPFGNRYQKLNTNIHGMDSATTKDSPGIADVWPEFENLIQKYGVVAAHNTEFHTTAILNSLKKDGWKTKALYEAELIDTSELTHCPLRYCIEAYGLDIEFKQDALCHALACAKLLIELRKRNRPTN